MILDNASPFYIKFTHVGLEEIVKECLKFFPVFENRKTFMHYRLPKINSEKILEYVPKYKELNIDENRVSLFITPPGHYYAAHKDGMEMQAGINYAILIQDNQCVTSWYNDQDLEKYEINTRGGISRDTIGFVKENHQSEKSMIFETNEAVLFNTNMFHDVDNSSSSNTRVILTLRSKNPSGWTFEAYKKILFPELN